MVYTQSNQTIAATGTPQTLSGGTARSVATWIIVQALDNNSAEIYVGGANPANKSASLTLKSGRVGVKLVAGATLMFPQISGVSIYDLSTIWVSGTAADGYSVTYAIK
jgi:hypothetical protein